MIMTYYEIKKVFSKKGSKVALIFIFIVISVVLSFIIGDNKYVNRNGDAESGISAMLKVRELKKEWSGDCDYGEFNDYNYYLADSLSPDEAVDFYSNRIKNLKNWLETDGKDQFSEKEKSYLIRAYEKMKTPLYYDYQAGWKNLFQYSPSIIMILTLVLGFLCAGIFSGEFQLKANAVFYSSYYGRNKAVWAKVKAGAIIITAIYWAVMLLYTMLVLGILGVDGANCPIQSSMSGWKSIYNITNAQEYILIVLGGYLGCLFMQSLTMLVSAKTNSSVIAVIVPFILIFLPENRTRTVRT